MINIDRIWLNSFIFLFSITISTSQTRKKQQLKNVSVITSVYKIGYLNYDKKYNLYHKPVIIENKKKYSITDYDNNFGSEGLIQSISPNRKYIILDYIDKGYLGDEKDKIIHEVYFCVIIDLKNHMVVSEMESGCGGEWDENNKWIYGNKIIFDGN